MLEPLQAGAIPVSIEAHESVCRHYGIASIFLAREVAQRIAEFAAAGRGEGEGGDRGAGQGGGSAVPVPAGKKER